MPEVLSREAGATVAGAGDLLPGIGYRDFLLHLGPVAVVGLFLDWFVLWWLYFRGRVHDVRTEPVVNAVQIEHAALLKAAAVAALVLAGFLAGFSPPLVASVGAAVLLITRTRDPHLVYEEVDWGLLVFFVGLFLIVGGAENAGLTRLTGSWRALQSATSRGLYARHRDPLERCEQRARRNAFEIVGQPICQSSFCVAHSGHGQHACWEPDDYRLRRQHHRCRTRTERGGNHFLRLLSDRFACHPSDTVVWLALAFLDSVNWPTLSREFSLQVLRHSSRRKSCGVGCDVPLWLTCSNPTFCVPAKVWRVRLPHA